MADTNSAAAPTTSSGTFDFDSAFDAEVKEAGVELDPQGDSVEQDDAVEGGDAEEGEEDVSEEDSEEDSSWEEAPEEEEETPAEAPAEAPADAPVDAKSSKQVVTISDAGKEYKVPEVALVEVKIDGAITKVPLQDLRSSYSSKQVRDREFQEARRLKTTVEQERNYVASQVASFAKKVQEGQGLQAFSDILELANVDPITTIRGLRNDLVSNAQGYLQLSEDERKLLDAQEENEYNKSRLEKIQTSQTLERDKAVLLERVQGVIATYGMSSLETFSESYLELEQIQKSGRLPPHIKELTPELVGEFHQSKTLGQMLVDVVKEEGLTGKLSEDESRKLYQAVLTFKPTVSQLKKTLKDLYGSARIDEASKNLSEKLNGKAATVTPGKTASNSKTQTKPTGSRGDPRLDWDSV